MLRMRAPSCIHLAILGRCSLIWMPGTLVAMGLNSPPSLVPGLRSKVSLWVGPPSIHRTMQDLCLTPVWAAWAASTGSQPDSEVAATPAADSLSRSRRERSLVMVGSPLGVQAHPLHR